MLAKGEKKEKKKAKTMGVAGRRVFEVITCGDREMGFYCSEEERKKN